MTAEAPAGAARARALPLVLGVPGSVSSSVLSPEVSMHTLDAVADPVWIQDPVDGDLIVLHAMRGMIELSSTGGLDATRSRSHVLAPGTAWSVRAAGARVVIAIVHLGEVPRWTTEGMVRTGLAESIAALGAVSARRPVADPASRQALADATLRLAHALVAPPSLGMATARDSDLYRAARRLIVAHRAEPSLSVERLARTLSVTPRHLQRVFKEHGRSPGLEIRRQRVALAENLLGQFPRPGLGEVARACGFTSSATSRRAFAAVGRSLPGR